MMLYPVVTYLYKQRRSAARTRRPASADRTARRQFQATGQPVSRTQASDAMTSRLPRCEAKCVQRRCFQCRSVPLRSDIKGTELPPANVLIPLVTYLYKQRRSAVQKTEDARVTMPKLAERHDKCNATSGQRILKEAASQGGFLHWENSM